MRHKKDLQLQNRYLTSNLYDCNKPSKNCKNDSILQKKKILKKNFYKLKVFKLGNLPEISDL